MAGKLSVTNLQLFKEDGAFLGSRKSLQKIKEECVKAIHAVDIRNIKPLIELCPKSVPGWIKNAILRWI